jgi:hypothetical protein
MIMAIPNRPTFKDSVLEEAFSSQGYVVVNLAEPDEMKELAEAYRDLYPYNQEGCVFSCHDRDSDRRLKAQNLLRQVFGKKASVLLDGYKFINSAFVAKYPGENGVIPPHTDFTFVDDNHYSAVAVWAPLTETTPEAGRLHILPGSHRYTPLCGSNLSRKYTDIELSTMTEIGLDIGQAVCYNLRTIHASPANTSWSPRIAGNCVFIPKEADLWHVTRQDREILIYAVDDGFYSRLGSNQAITEELLSNYRVIHSEPLGSELSENASQRNNSPALGLLQRATQQLGLKNPFLKTPFS